MLNENSINSNKTDPANQNKSDKKENNISDQETTVKSLNMSSELIGSLNLSQKDELVKKYELELYVEENNAAQLYDKFFRKFIKNWRLE